jgi:hypothetical protein
MNRSEAMMRSMIVAALAAAVLSCGTLASAQTPQKPMSFPVEVKGSPGVNIELFVNNGKLAEGTFNVTGDFSSLVDLSNNGKTRLTVYVDVCKDGKVVKVLLVSGAPPPKDEDCERRSVGPPFFNDCGVIRLTVNVLQMFAQPVGCTGPLTRNRMVLVGGAIVGGSLIAFTGSGDSPTATTNSPPSVTVSSTTVPTVQQPTTQVPPVQQPPANQPPPTTNTPSASGNYRCILCLIKSDGSNHNPTLRGCDGLVAILVVIDASGTLTIRHPSPFIEVSGTYNASTGAFDLSGTGSIAGFNNVSSRVIGTVNLQSGRMVFDWTLGANGVFPGGQPITYSVTIQLQQ